MASLYIPLCNNGIGLVRASWAASMFGLGVSGVLSKYRVVFDSFAHPDPSASMNHATHRFMETGCDRMLIIDADHIFRPQDVAVLLSNDLDFVSGLYPKKCIITEWPVQPLNDEQTPEVLFDKTADSPVEVKCVPRGFLALKRRVFEVLEPHVEKYSTDDGIMSIFWQAVSGGITEDFALCNLWREYGGQVWLDHRVRVFHEGNIVFPLKTI